MRLVNWDLFFDYKCEDTCWSLMKMVSTHDDGYSFTDYSWENAFTIHENVYPEWCLEFFSTMYFEGKVDWSNIMKEKCVWFRLCGREHAYTLLEFVVILVKLVRGGGPDNVAWILAMSISRKAPGIKEEGDICGGHYVTKITKMLGYHTVEELGKCSGPMISEI
ncbi:hypothetical protein Tco_1050549 [Tanacetum coccineum]